MRHVLALLVALVVGAATAPADGKFIPQCVLRSPLDEIGKPRHIDHACAPEGRSTPGDPELSEAHKDQNRAKNNYCATGAPATLTRDAFVQLQQKTFQMKQAGQIDYGERDQRAEHVPQDRSLLRDLIEVGGVKVGEGTVVRHVAIIKEARHFNVGKGNGETVNCKFTGFGDKMSTCCSYRRATTISARGWLQR